MNLHSTASASENIEYKIVVGLERMEFSGTKEMTASASRRRMFFVYVDLIESV
jgi:hypothetical protein